jgi:hypothetical protein
MKRGRHRRRLFAAICLAAPVSAVQADRYAVLDYAYRSGDFGTGVTTELTTFTLTLGWLDSGAAFNVALPYQTLRQESLDTVSGLGDIVLHGSRDFAAGASSDSNITVGAMLKLPTADDSEGLGSGEMDVGLNFGWSADYGDWRPMLSVGYTLVGDPPGIDYNDVLAYGAGIFRRFTRSGVFISLDGRNAVVEGADPAREISVGGFYLFSSLYALSVGAFQGLTDGSADYGFNAGVLRRF